MTQITDTRALTRAAFPHVLSTGANPSVSNVKAWVREHLNNPDWNPSAGTVQDELNKIREEIGKSILSGASLPTLPDHLVKPTIDFLGQIFSLIREEARGELAEKEAVATAAVKAAEAKAIAAEEKTATATDELQAARQDFEKREIKLVADVTHLSERVEELSRGNNELKASLSASEARVTEQAELIATIRAEREADAKRFGDQIALADERYRDLTASKMQEIDNARTQRDRAVLENDRMRSELSDVRTQLSTKSMQASEAAGENKALLRELESMRAALAETQQAAADARSSEQAAKAALSEAVATIEELKKEKVAEPEAGQ